MGVSLRNLTAISAFALLGCSGGGTVAGAGETPSPVQADVPGFFTVAQAQNGREIFTQICGQCHSTTEFRGNQFEFDWRRQTAWNFYQTISETMPEDMPGSLTDEQYVAVIAFVLEMNEYRAGSVDLLPNQQALEAIQLGTDAPKSPEQDWLK